MKNVTLRISFACLALCGLLFTLTGCSTAGIQAGDSSQAMSPYLLVDDPSLADQISVAKVAHDQVGDIMRATVTLKSNRNRSIQFQYRFSWYDQNGMELDGSGKTYRTLTLRGKDAVPVTSVAPSPYATEFKIRIQKVKAVKIENIF
jgi:uncharacterized protein YcfL